MKPRYKVDDLIYTTAYPKNCPCTFYTCKCRITGIIEKRRTFIYKVQIVEVGTPPIIVTATKTDPKHLLNKIITKREIDITKTLSVIMEPSEWTTLST
jgi:hypothetical protein